jgi:hypothetical protein
MVDQIAFSAALTIAVQERSRAARHHFCLAWFFGIALVGFLGGGIFYGKLLDSWSYGVGATILATLVLAQLRSSRSLQLDTTRLRILATYKSDRAYVNALEELTLREKHDDTTSSSLFKNIREFLINRS